MINSKVHIGTCIAFVISGIGVAFAIGFVCGGLLHKPARLQMQQYVAEIDQLNQKHQSLSAENFKLANANYRLEDDLKKAKIEIRQLSVEYEYLKSPRLYYDKKEIGRGFVVRNMRFGQKYDKAEIVGEIVNTSKWYRESCTISVGIYGLKDTLIDTDTLYMQSFPVNEPKPFSIVTDLPADRFIYDVKFSVDSVTEGSPPKN
jgi:hypothetical protein